MQTDPYISLPRLETIVDGYSILQDFDDFIDGNYMPNSDIGDIQPAVFTLLQKFYGMLISLEWESSPFADEIESVCETSEDYTSEDDLDEKSYIRDRIIFDIGCHMTEGVFQCARERMDHLDPLINSFKNLSSECQIEDTSDDDYDNYLAVGHLDELREIQNQINQAERFFVDDDRSWFERWKNNEYSIANFSECLQSLREVHECQLLELKCLIEIAIGILTFDEDIV